jgi:hypothetical protein
MRWAGHLAHKVKTRKAYYSFIGKPEGMKSHGRCRRGWENNIRIDFTEIGWEVVNWIHLANVWFSSGSL